jgi:hypothetical protein
VHVLLGMDLVMDHVRKGEWGPTRTRGDIGKGMEPGLCGSFAL